MELVEDRKSCLGCLGGRGKGTVELKKEGEGVAREPAFFLLRCRPSVLVQSSLDTLRCSSIKEGFKFSFIPCSNHSHSHDPSLRFPS